MKKSSIKYISLISVISIFLLIFNFIIKPKIIMFAESIMAAFLLIIVFTSIQMFGFPKDKTNKIKSNLLIKTTRIVTIYFIVIYLLGLYFGYSKIVFSLKPVSIINNTFAPIIIFICLELFRYVMINNSKDNTKKIVFISFIIGLMELLITTRYLDFTNFEAAYKTIADYIAPVAIKQIALSLLCYHGGLRSTLLYRIVMLLYTYIIPIHPSFSPTMLCISNIILPILLMMKVNEATAEEYEERESITPPNKVGTIIGVTLVAGIALVISGITPLGITAIASNSMMPAFDKGSAVITIKVKETELKEGDIISFNKGNKKIIHRINSIEETDGEKRYYTKGDANRTVDESYITYKDIDNKIILSIPLIGYPSIMISELLSK